MWSDLPFEILHDILLRLNVKTLIKCTTLSKYYHSLITNPEFIAAHIKNNHNQSTHLLLRYSPHKDSKERFCVEPDDDNFNGFDAESSVEVPFDMWDGGGWFNVLGSINGVICLVNHSEIEGQFIMWNPCIRKYVELPEPLYTFQAVGGYESVSGFMFDPVNNDFKVVRVVKFGLVSGNSKQVEVFSLRSGCWRDLATVDVWYRMRSFSGYKSCFSHGCVNWVVSDRSGPVILKFDMSSEGFEFMGMPNCFKYSKRVCSPLLDFHVQEFRGMLGWVHRDYDAHTCSLWIMKEYGVVDSWTKILNLNVRTLHPSFMPRAFWQRKSDEILMVKLGARSGGVVSVYWHVIVSIDSAQQGEISFGKIPAEDSSFYLSSYVESLALFDEGKESAAVSNEQSIEPQRKKRRT